MLLESYEATDLVVIGCTVPLLVAFGIIYAPRSLSSVRRGLQKFAEDARRLSEKSDEEDAMARLSEKMMNDKRLEQMQVILPVVSCVYAVNIVVTFVNTVGGMPRKLSFTQDLLVCAFFAFHMVAAKFICRYPRFFVSSVYASSMTWTLLAVVLADGPPTLSMYFQALTVLLRLIMSVAYMRLGVVFAATVGHSIAVCAVYSQKDLGQDPSAATSLTTFIQSEFWFSLCVVSMVWAWISMVKTSVRRDIDASATQSEAAASRRLLNTICDATFEVDQDLCVVGDACQLAGLLQHGPNRTLNGAKVEQLVCAKDRQRFRERVSAHVPDSQEMANVFHVDLRDSLSNSFSVEVFHVPILGSLVGVRHLIGVREPEPAAKSEQTSSRKERILGEADYLAHLVQSVELDEQTEPPTLGVVPSSEKASEASAQEMPASRLVFDANTFNVLEASGGAVLDLSVGCNLKRLLDPQSDFWMDLDMAMEVLRHNDAMASFEFRSVLERRRGSAILKSLCKVRLAARPGADAAAGEPSDILGSVTVERTKSHQRASATASRRSAGRRSMGSSADSNGTPRSTVTAALSVGSKSIASI